MRAIFIAVLLAAVQSGPDYPATPKRPSHQVYGDTTFVDNYEWLESADDAAVKAWVAEENRLRKVKPSAICASVTSAERASRLATSAPTTASRRSAPVHPSR